LNVAVREGNGLFIAFGDDTAAGCGRNVSFTQWVYYFAKSILRLKKTMSCTPISVSLEVNPSDLRKIVFDLDKICNDDDTVEWKLHFDLQVRSDPNGTFRSLVKLDVDINKENHALAEATARHGMDEDQRSQAAVAGDTAEAFKKGQASQEDAEGDAQDVIAARNPASPAA
jgi:hypothetical protein